MRILTSAFIVSSALLLAACGNSEDVATVETPVEQVVEVAEEGTAETADAAAEEVVVEETAEVAEETTGEVAGDVAE